MKSYVNLHTHTVYSQLDGYGHAKVYAKQGKALGMPAMGITDHGNLHGWLPFYDACQEEGIKPILGMEAYQARKTRFDRDEEERAGRANDELEQRGPYHLTLLARNLQGYKNIIKLSSRAFLEGYYGKPRLDHQLLAEHSEGVTVLSGCLNGEVQQALIRGDYGFARAAAARFQDIVGRDHFFMEIMDHGLREQAFVREGMLKLARELNAPLVPTGDCHYVFKEDAHAHDVMLCVSTKSTLADDNRFKFSGDEFYLRPYEDMERLFPESWLENSLVVAEQVDLDLQFGELYFPDYPLPPGENLDDYLEKLVWQGLKERYGEPLSQEVIDRAQYELRVVKKMGFQSYFLVVWDLVKWAKDNGIRVGWGRGSAAGCILSFALRITNLDPLRFGLLFERFLVEGRKSMPDIDLDFDDRYRDRVIEYARQKYGTDRVAHICTFGTIGARQAIRDAARVLGYEYSEGDRVANLIPPPVLGKSKTIDEALTTPEMKKAYEGSETARHIIDSAKGLEGLVRQVGIHAAGVVISKGPITDYVPVMQRGEGEPIVTQWDDDTVERFGQLKIDFLAIRNLAVLDMCLDNIKETRGLEIDLDEIPIDDDKTFESMRIGNTMGTFQLESSGMRDMVRAIQPQRIDDVMAVISLFRPGALGSGADKLYISRKNGRQEVAFDHPALASVLNTTYGIMLYQEDVLNVARQLAGFTTGEADDLRKAIGKKLMDQIGKYRQMFVDGAKKTSGASDDIANKIYSDIEYFGGYGFNRAHAASYAMVSYATAYFKTNYPAEYMAALLTSVFDSKAKAAQYLNECRRMGIEVIPPSINESRRDFRVVSDKQILFGLLSITGIGQAVLNMILSCRDEPYTSVYDFLRRVDPDVLNKLTLEHLVHSGALDELVEDQPERLLSRQEKLALLSIEKAELGLYVSDHPLLGVWHVLEPHVTCTIQDLDSKPAGETVKLGGLLSVVNKRTTKRGDTMFVLTLEDLSGSIDILVFPKDAARHLDSFVEGDIIVIEGRVQKEGDEENPISKVFFSDFEKPNIPDYGTGTPIVLRFQEQPAHATLLKMEELIEATPGDSPVYLEYPEGPHTIALRFKKPTSLNIQEALEMLTLKDGYVV